MNKMIGNPEEILSECVSGFHQYVLTEPVRLAFVSRSLCEMLGCTAEELLRGPGDGYAAFVHPADQALYGEFLHTLTFGEQTRTLSYRLVKKNGSVCRVSDTASVRRREDGTFIGSSVLTDITGLAAESEIRRYVNALSDVYDKIFSYDFSEGTVTCLRGQNSPVYQRLENIPMRMEEATAKWITNSVLTEDRESVRAFFRTFFTGPRPEGGQPPRIRYRALSSDGSPRAYTGIFLQIDGSVSLFCCRRAADAGEAAALVSENASLKKINENMQQMVMQFTDGIAAFEVLGDCVTPLYASDNVCEFFGFTRDEWMPLMKQSNSIREFVSRSGVAYEAFVELLQNGEAEFTYRDLARGTERRIKAICSQKSPGGTSPRYVMLYNVDGNVRDQTADRPAVSIRTFGYFDVFVGEQPIAFRSQKSKELFALLVDRRGGYVSSEEAISFLWEEEAVNAVTQARYRKVALRLKNILEEYGIADVVESVDGKRRIVPDRVRCDLYDYLSGREEFAQLFKGSYLTNYSWGETTLGALMGDHFPL